MLIAHNLSLSLIMEGGRPSDSAAEDMAADIRKRGFHSPGIAVHMRPDTGVTDTVILSRVAIHYQPGMRQHRLTIKEAVGALAFSFRP